MATRRTTSRPTTGGSKLPSKPASRPTGTSGKTVPRRGTPVYYNPIGPGKETFTRRRKG